MQKLDYATQRDNIKNGQLVFLGSNHKANFGQKVIQAVTHGEYTHAGITVWLMDSFGQRRLMMLESTLGGVRLVNLSCYLHRKMVIVDIGLNWEEVHRYALAGAGFIGYGNMDFILIGLRENLVRIGLPKLAARIPNKKGQVCSEYVMDIVNRDPQYAKYKLSTLVSPSYMLKLLQDMGFVYDQVELVYNAHRTDTGE